MLSIEHCFKIYMSLKLHFITKGYDIFKYNGNIPHVLYKPNKARDSLLYRLQKRCKTSRDLVQFIVASYAYGNNSSLYDAMTSEDYFEKWEKHKISMTQIIFDDLEKYDFDVGKMFKGDPPQILKDVTRGTAQIESLVAVNRLAPGFLQQDYLGFSVLCLKINKLDKFIKFNETKIKKELGIEYASV